MNPNFSSRLTNFLKEIGKVIFKQLSNIFRFFISTIGYLLSKINNRYRVFGLILLLLWMVIVWGSFILKGSYIFEGNLIVKGMGFTYNGGQTRTFLNPINNIITLDLQGIQLQPLILTGKFTSNDANINQKLNKLKTLKLDFQNPDSRLIISSEKPNISLLSLNLQPQTTVNQLTYNFINNTLSFCLTSSHQSVNTCQFIDYFQTPDQPQTITELTLTLKQQPLTLTLNNIPISQLKNLDSEIELQFTPDRQSTEKILTFKELATLEMKIQPISKNQKINWFWGDIDVSKVRFQELDTTANINDQMVNSTILKGMIRLEDKTLSLQEKQFLIVDQPETAIRKLRSLQIHPQDPQGIQTFISGKSKEVAVGLYPEFPVQSLQPSFLSKYLSQEAINTILSFIGALFGFFLPYFFTREN